MHSLPLDEASRAEIAARMAELAGLQTPPELSAEAASLLRDAVDDSFVAGFRAVALISAGLALLSALVSAVTIPPRAINK